MTTTLLTEEVRQQRLRVDRARGIIRDVKLLGWKSANGRRYDPKGVNPSLYEGRPANCDHVKPGQEGSVRDTIGWFEGVEKRSDGLYAKALRLLNPAGEFEQRLMAAAESAPHLFGLSHTARGRMGSSMRDPTVEAVEEVKSVDLVREPASTRGLYESRSAAPARELRRLKAQKLLREAADAAGVKLGRTALDCFEPRTVAEAQRIVRGLTGRGARGAPTPAAVSGAARHDPDFVASVRRRKLLEQVRQRLSNHPPRLARLFTEMVEDGLMGNEPGSAASGITTPGKDAPAEHPEAALRRKTLKAKVQRILDDGQLTIDEVMAKIVELLSDPEGACASDAEVAAKAQESRRSGALSRRLSNTVSLAEARSLASRLARA